MNKLELLDEKSRQAELGGGTARIEKQKAGGKMRMAKSKWRIVFIKMFYPVQSR